METLWKVVGFVLGLISAQLCNGLPINLTTAGPDPNTQYLTGLVAVLLAICSIILLAGCVCCRRNKNGFTEFRDSPVVASVASNLDHGHVNPIANSEFTIFTPISPTHHNNNVFLANQRIVNRTQEDFKYGDIDVSSWFDGSEKDFPRTRLKYIRELGKGWFGRIVEGTAQGLSQDPGEPEWTPVVVRILEASASSKERVLFLHDADVYRHGYHPNILLLLGRCLDTSPLLLLQEYCSEGDLKKYLRSMKSAKEKFLSSDLPLLWCYQLTQALKFLHEQGIPHPDLAARNCQLTKDLTLKLGDYGLNSSFYPEDYYQGSLAVPLRWCAPEIISYTNTTIQTKKPTLEGNIWSLGITMWEIMECGEQPYSELGDDDVISQVLGSANIRLPRPTFNVIYTDYMYELMQSCWSTAESRRSATHIDLRLNDLMQVYENTKVSMEQKGATSIQDFEQRWEALKPNGLITDETPLMQEDKKSESLTNLHGSLDNLLDDANPMDSWLENVANNTGDLVYAKGLSEAMMDLDNALDLSSDSNEPSPRPLHFQLGQKVITTSESETEDENWKKKIECGAYTEKVRQKSRSVADLMILTHVDYSESDSETLPSLTEYKNQKPKYFNKNMENPALKFGSEGNLLSVHDTFQEELRKLQDERRDSLLFVPDKYSYTDSKSAESSSSRQLDSLENSPVKKLIVELNSPSEMIPPKQVYNVFNVSVKHLNNLGEVDNKNDRKGLQKKTSCDSLKESKDNRDINHIKNNSFPPEKTITGRDVSCDKTKTKSEQNDEVFAYHTKVPSNLDKKPKSFENLNDFHIKIEVLSDQSSPIEEEITSQDLDRPGSSDDYMKETRKLHVPKLSEIIQRNVTLKSSSEDKLLLTKFTDKDLVDKDSGLNTPENSASLEKLYDDMEEILDEPSVLKKCSKCAISFEENEVYTGSFDSDKSNDIKVDLHKDLCLLKEEIKISSSDGSGCEEDSGTGTSSKETQSIDDNLSAKSLEDALDMINNDYCLRRSKIICESFLANEKSNYSPTDEYREICFVTNTKLTDYYLEEKSHKDISHQIQLIPDLLTGLPDVDKNYKDDKIETLTEYLLKPLIHMESFQTMESKTSNSLNTESNSNNLNLTKTSVILPIIKSSPNDKESEDSISSSKSDSIESVAEFLSPEISQASDFKTISECSQNNASLALAIDSSVPNTMLDVSSEEMKTLEDADSTKTLGGDSDSDVNNMEEFSECQLKHTSGESREIDVSTDEKILSDQDSRGGEYQETLRLVRRDSFDILRKTKEFLCQELVFYDKEDISDVLLRNSFNKDVEATENVNELNDVNITSLSKIIHINEELTDKLLNDEETSSNIQRVILNEIRDADIREQNVKTGQSMGIPSNNFIKELSGVDVQFEEVFENKSEDRIINNAISNVSVIGDCSNEVSEGTDKDNKMNESQAITKESHLIGNAHERLSVQELSETFESKYENVDNQKQLEKNLCSTTDDTISLIKQLEDNTTTHETQVPNFLADTTNNINQQPDLLITINDRTVTSETSLDSFLGMFENSEDCTNFEIDLSKDCDHEKLDSDKVSTVSVNTIEKPEKKILEEFGVLSMSSKEETVQSKSLLNKVCSNENIESNKQTDLKCDTEQIENCRLDENEVTLQVQEPKFEAGEFQVFTMETSETSPIKDRSEIHKINSPPEYPNKSNLEIVEKSMSEKCDVLLGDKMVEVKNCSDLSYASSKENFGDLPSNQESESEDIVEMVEKPVSERCGIENVQSETLHPYRSDFNSSSKSCTKNPLNVSSGNPIISEQSINITAPMLEKEFEKEDTNQDLNCFNDLEPHENVDHHTASLIQDSNYTRPMNELVCQSAAIQCQLANAEIHPSNVENQTNLDMSDLPIISKVVKKEPISNNSTRDTPDFELVKNSMGTSIEDGCDIRPTIAAGYNKDIVLNIPETSEMTHNKSLEINSKNEELNPIEVEDILIGLTTENTKNIDILSNSNDTPNAPTSLLKQEEEVKELFQSLLGDPVKEENFNQLQTILNKTKDFLNNEIQAYADKPKQELLVQFDLSDSQEEIAPNSLTHFQGFTSTPFSKKRSLESTVILGANDDYSMDFYSGLKTAVDPVEAEELKFSSNFMQEGCREQNNDLYSLETWDNFLGKSFDEQENDLDFITFNQEPHSLLFLENSSAEYEDKLERTNNLQVSHVVNETYVPENQNGDKTFCKEPCSDKTCNVMNEQEADVTYTKNEGTFVKNESINEHLNVDLGKPSTSTGWESGGGWFLHPQSNSEELSGQIAVQESTVDSYVGFSMDDEIMAAIRNELLNKLPHAQRASSEHVKEQEELEPAEKNEVFIRYNVYNTPLSPIPEESYIGSDDDSPVFTPKRVNQVSDDDSSDWSIEDNVSSNLHTEINSPKLESSMISSPAKFPNHRHTPSQDSCCSNDTLFNIEDLNLAIEHDRIFETIPDEDESSKESKYSDCKAEIEDVEDDTLINDKLDEKEILGTLEVPKISIHNYITDFLNNERYNQLNSCIELSDLKSEYEECSSASDKYLTVSDNTLSFGQNVAPLNSPEDRQWKDLQASFRDCEEAEDQSNKLNTKFLTPIENTELDDVQKISRSFELVTDLDDPDLDNLEDCRISDEDIDKVLQEEDEEFISANKEGLSNSNTKLLVDNISPNLDKEGISSTQKEDNRIYVNTPSSSEGNTIIQNTDLDVTEYDGSVKNEDSPEYVYIEKHEDNHEYENGWIADTIYANMPADRAKELDYVIAEENKKAEENIEDLYGPLADIRFSGPGLANLQIMSTSFSESNEVGDEQDWDSGSDTRSSSSGEFIWREGEHEASLKALDAAPQAENTQEMAPMEDIQEENESSSSDSDGEGECPEFVPSAWDKYAIPTKSALRSPEKTLERKEAKDKKVVWFKKQKYHCIYEYPKEPDSPILQSYDLWKPTPDYATLADWELGPDMYVPRFDLIEPLTSVTDQQRSPKNLYHLTAFPEKGATVLDDDFYVSSSSKPFDMLGGMTSQFFPGQQFSDHWVDATTPDSGDEVLPVRENNRIPTLKHLATIAANKNRKLRDLGGLRHTRSKLKLDLPPSPSAFSSNTTFTVEPVEEIVPRQVPTFSTFGKSRFLVQHVDTPPDDKSTNKNVSFEALPYKPQAQTVKERQKIESVRGEASLLDSADEDSGIDSSTLERGKKVGT